MVTRLELFNLCKYLPLLFICLNLYSQSEIEGSNWENIRTKKSTVITCLWNEAYGIIYKNENDELKGVCVDILNDFSFFLKEKYDLTVTIKYLEEKSFSKFLSTVSNKKNIIGASSVSITEERKNMLRFTTPFLTNPNIIVTNREASKLTNLKDISNLYAGYKLKVVEGSMHYFYALEIKKKYYPTLKVEVGPSSKEILEEIVKDKTIFSIIDFAEYIGATRNRLNITRQNVPLEFVDNMGFIMNKNSDWGQIWDEFLNKDYLNSVRYKKLVSENMGSSYLSLLAN